MILIADAGSTKIHWAIADNGLLLREFETPGVNPVMLGIGALHDRLCGDLAAHLSNTSPDRVYYYGAGCIAGMCDHVAEVLRIASGCREVYVASDMLGAARGVCGHVAGLVGILGTGSNSCLYDGEKIVDAVPALGYVLGDEGSGSVIGRRLLGDLFKRLLSEAVSDAFDREYGLSMADVVDHVYRRPEANKFLASFMPFVKRWIADDTIVRLVEDEFTRFLERNMAAYNTDDSMPVNFVGSVAVNFEPQLRNALTRCGMRCGRIVSDPLSGLIEYHNETYNKKGL